MIKKEHLKTFKEFIFEIEGLNEAKQKEKGYGIGRDIEKVMESVSADWMLQSLSENLPSRKTKPKNTLAFNTGHETLGNSIHSGNITKRTLNTIICYFFYGLSKNLSEPKYNIQKLERLISFFELIEVNQLKADYRLDCMYLIDNFLKIIKLDQIHSTLTTAWQLKFTLITEQGIKTELFLVEKPVTDNHLVSYEKDIPNGVDSINLNQDKYSDYLKRISHEFEYIHFDLVKFKIPISKYVKKPLLKPNETIRLKLLGLEQQKEELYKNYHENKIPIKNLQKQISKLNTILNKKHNIEKVLDLGGDIFIEAPAGYGKSTTLRWLTYKYSNNSKGFLPIFIELMYNTENNLKGLIQERLEENSIDKNTYKTAKTLLLLDGYDQFNGNKNKLFRDVKSIKATNPKVQIVFSGRTLPKLSLHNLNLTIYNITAFDNEDIKQFTKAYLGDNKGAQYYDFMLSRNLMRHIDRPLHLCLFLGLVKFEIENNNNDIEQITKEISNKGRLLNRIILEYFVNKYEGDRQEISKSKWENRKKHQIEALSYLAWEMTFNRKNSEVIKKSLAIKLLKKYYQDNKTHKKLKPSKTIDEFISHNLLHLENELLSFNKKELRSYFVANHLKNNIESYNTYKHYKERLGSITSNENEWNSIQHYLIGLIDSNKILNEFEKINFKAPLILDKDFMIQYELAFEFVDQKNISAEQAFLNGKYLIKLTKLILEKFISVNENRKDSLTILSIRPLLRKIIKKYDVPDRFISKELEDKLNQQFFQFQKVLKYNAQMSPLLMRLIRYDIGISLKELITIVRLVKDIDKKYFNSENYMVTSYIYDNILRQKDCSLRLRPKDKVDIAFEYLFKEKSSSRYIELFRPKSSRLKLFISDVMEDYTSEFFNCLFSNLDTIHPFQIRRFIFFLIHGKYYWWLKFKSNILLKNNADTIFLFSKKIYLNGDETQRNFHKFKNILVASTDNYFVGLYLDFFKSILFDLSYSKTQRLRVFFYLFLIKRKSDMQFLTQVFKDKEPQKIAFLLEAVETHFPKEHRFQKQDFDSNLINLYCEILKTEKINPNLARDIFQNSKYTDVHLNKIVINLLSTSNDLIIKSSILEFVGYFKIREAIPVMEELLNKYYYRVKSFYYLSLIDNQFYYKHKSKFKIEYDEAVLFLNTFNANSLNQEVINMLFQIKYIGDKALLELLRDKSHLIENVLETMDDRYFLRGIEKGLTEKCYHLENKNLPN